MKKYLSVFMLYTRSTFYKLFFTLLLAGAAQIFLFYRKLREYLPPSGEPLLHESSYSSLISESKLPLIFLIAFLITLVILMTAGLDGKGKMSYTLRRLSVTEKEQFFIQTLYNSLAFFLLYTFEILTVHMIGLLFLKTAPEAMTSHQTLFLNCYGNDFLHSLIPLEETSRLIRNFFIVAGLGFVTAWHPYVTRREKKHMKSIFYITFVTGGFITSFGSFYNDLFLGFLSLLAIVVIGYKVMKEEVSYEA